MSWATPSMFRGELMGDPATSFIEGVSWPVDRASLVALSDLGLSPHQIARYFSVTAADVRSLLNSTTPVEAATGRRCARAQKQRSISRRRPR